MHSFEAFGVEPTTSEAAAEVPPRTAQRMLTKLQHENGINDEATDFAEELAKGGPFSAADVMHVAMALYEQKVEDPVDKTKRSQALDESYAKMCAEKEELTEDECAAGVVSAYELFVGGMDDGDIRRQLAKEYGDKGNEEQLNGIMRRMYERYKKDTQRAA